ncbi:hypothetical protein ACQR16_27030 [Bradyrhizobium oligotrophicum]|uniref:hypothetical protein n=1 Tax=Bradyrhizobium oligotrophicum TaxID=44255 RepID=UPI003EBE31D1
MSRFYATETEISERIEFLKDIGRSLQTANVIPSTVIFREARVAPMVRGYFLLNKAYKNWRIHSGHNTEKPKIGALMAVAINRFQPFLPIHPANVKDTAEARCNEVYALTYALSILEKPFTPDTPEKLDFWHRVLEIISGSSCVTLEPYFVDVRYQTDRALNEYTLAIQPQDKLSINSLISIFELISDKGDALRR